MAQYVDIPLDKQRRIRYTINAIRELERTFGRSFTQIFNPETLGVNEIVHLLYIGLKYGSDEGKKLSVDKVGDLVQKKWLDNDRELQDITDYILDGMRAAGIIQKKDDDDEDDDAAAVPAGGGKKPIPNA